MSVRRKIRDVPDQTCIGCKQLWQNECRAFEVPHTQAERRWRNGVSPVPQCIKNILNRGRLS